jgi:hypothetical protein
VLLPERARQHARRLDIPSDTDADAHGIQREIYRHMGGQGRVAVAFRLTDAVRRLSMAGVRARHPDYTEAQVRQAYARLRLGDALVRTVWPDQPLVDP